MFARHRLALIASLVLILALGACGTESISPTSAPGAGTTAVATPQPTATPTPSLMSSPSPTPAPVSTPVTLSFIQQPTRILLNGRLKTDKGSAGTDYGIYSVDSDGMNLTRLDAGTRLDYYPEWSPDGQQIVFMRVLTSPVDPEGTPVIVIMNADGSDERVLTSRAEASFAPAWSPDGKQIAFERLKTILGPDEMPDGVVSVMNADGTNLHDVGRVGYAFGAPSWSPDSSRIVFAGSTGMEPAPDQSPSFFIYVVQADGNNLQSIAGPGLVIGPSWSPDGSKIAFQKLNETVTEPDVAGAAASMLDIWIVNPDGSNPRALTGDQFRMAFFPAWSPDGEQIAFVGVQRFVERMPGRGDTSIYAANADGSNLRRLLAEPDAMPMAPSWSPDGHAIAYLAMPTSPGTFDNELVCAELRLVAADGSEHGTILNNFFVEQAFDPFDALVSPAPDWRPAGR